MCHSCGSRNPVYSRESGNLGNMEFSYSYSYFLDSRLRGNDTLGLARLGRGRLLHSAKMLRKYLAKNSGKLSFPGFLGFARHNMMHSGSHRLTVSTGTAPTTGGGKESVESHRLWALGQVDTVNIGEGAPGHV